MSRLSSPIAGRTPSGRVLAARDVEPDPPRALALARVAGETAPLLFTALGNRSLTCDPSQPFPSITKQVYDYVTGPYEAQKQVGWAGVLVLIALLLVLNAMIRVVSARAMRGRK